MWSIPFAGGPLTKLAPYTDKLLRFAWSPDQQTVVLVGHDHDVVLVELATGAVRELRGHTDALYTVTWTQGRQAAALGER